MKAPVLYILVFLGVFTACTQAAIVCGQRSSCTSCVADNTQCGWCVTRNNGSACVDGAAAGPYSSRLECVIWQFSVSQVVSTTPGYPVTPKAVDVFLKPREYVKVKIEVTPQETNQQKLDFVVAQDASGSMADDIATFRLLATKLVNDILAYKDDAYFSLTTFIEKPMHPVGKIDGSNWNYKMHQALSVNYNDFKNQLLAVQIKGNDDWCEAALDGMSYAILDSTVAWRPDAKRVIFAASDACFHQQGDIWNNKTPYNASSTTCGGDYQNCCKFADADYYPTGHCPFQLPPNNMDSVLDVYPFANSSYALPGTGEDYFSQDQWKYLMLKNNIVPIFAITNTEGSPQDEMTQWTGLRDNLGFGAYYPLTSDSSNLVQAIILSLQELSRTVKMSVATDQFNYTRLIEPADGYKNVDITQVVSFNVTFYTESAQVIDNVIQLTVFGFGTVDVHIYPALPCRGCDGVTNSDEIVDLCGLCGGNDACLDCAGVPYGSTPLDLCGVCGGNSTTCLGCDGVPNSGKQNDSCGVCDGGNQCVGCDKKPGNPPKEFDLCGVCGGNDLCLDCNNVPFGNKTLDECGVCGGNGDCLGCDKKHSIPPLQFDSCGVCGGNDSCYDCAGVKNGNTKTDLCGVCNGTNQCRGCDGRYDPNNKTIYDQCGQCGGDGKKCLGCDGVVNSTAKIDACGICGGFNSCVGCDGVPYSNLVYDACGVCGGNSDCIGCDYVINSTKVFDKCGECGGNNTCLGCDGIPFSGKRYDVCGVCQGDGTSCVGCDGVVNSGKIFDQCGVCGGKDLCVGCDEVPYSGATYDRCGICNGKSDCVGCDGMIPGLKVDLCGVCPNALNYTPNACVGCDGIPYSGLKNDSCGVCNGTNACVGCDKVPNSGVKLDECGLCPVPPANQTYTPRACYGCDGVPFSNLTLDQCGICPNVTGYKNGSCIGCDGIPNSKLKLDKCGICPNVPNYKENDCLGCDGIPNSGLLNDSCGVCNGNGSTCLSGCDLMPNSKAVLDECGKCGGDGSTCKKQPFITQKRTIAIGAGTVGGVIVGVAALVAGLFLYKRLTAGAFWYIPKDLLDSSSSAVIDNPLFDPKGEGFVESPLFDQ